MMITLLLIGLFEIFFFFFPSWSTYLKIPLFYSKCCSAVLGIYTKVLFEGTFSESQVSFGPAEFSNLDLSVNEINNLDQTPVLSILQTDYKTQTVVDQQLHTFQIYSSSEAGRYLNINRTKKQRLRTRCFFVISFVMYM